MSAANTNVKSFNRPTDGQTGVTHLVDLVDESGEFLGFHDGLPDENSAFPDFTRCSYFPVLPRPDLTWPFHFRELDRDARSVRYTAPARSGMQRKTEN